MKVRKYPLQIEYNINSLNLKQPTRIVRLKILFAPIRSVNARMGILTLLTVYAYQAQDFSAIGVVLHHSVVALIP